LKARQLAGLFYTLDSAKDQSAASQRPKRSDPKTKAQRAKNSYRFRAPARCRYSHSMHGSGAHFLPRAGRAFTFFQSPKKVNMTERSLACRDEDGLPSSVMELTAFASNLLE